MPRQSKSDVILADRGANSVGAASEKAGRLLTGCWTCTSRLRAVSLSWNKEKLFFSIGGGSVWNTP